jgi:hypothetical protein
MEIKGIRRIEQLAAGRTFVSIARQLDVGMNARHQTVLRTGAAGGGAGLGWSASDSCLGGAPFPAGGVGGSAGMSLGCWLMEGCLGIGLYGRCCAASQFLRDLERLVGIGQERGGLARMELAPPDAEAKADHTDDEADDG